MKQNSAPNEHPLFNKIEAIARTNFSHILLVCELRARELAILKVASQDIKALGNSLSTSEKAANNESVVNEVRVLQSIHARVVHPALPELLAVKNDDSYLAVDRATQSNYLAEPYYSGMTFSDLINTRGYFKKRFVYIARRSNLRLLLFRCRYITIPENRNMLRWLGVPDHFIIPSREITSGNPLPVHQAILFIHQIADGLHCLYTNGSYVHLDLKPSNIMLKKLQWPGHESSDNVVIIDFGETRKKGITATMGTPLWRPSEQVDLREKDNKTINVSKTAHSMDIYSLGQVFGYLLTGIHPKDLGTRQYTDLASTFIYPAGISKKEKDELSVSIIAILRGCLDKPSLRPSAEAIRSDLSKIEKTLPPPRLWKRRLALAILSLFAILCGFFSLPQINAYCNSQPQQMGESICEFRETVIQSAKTLIAPVPTDTPTPVPTDSPTPVPTDSPTPVPTDSPTPVPTDSPTPVPTDSPTPVPTDSPTPVPTDSPTPVPTDSPTPVPTDSPTPVPTDSPTPVPTDSPTPVPTDSPTPVPTDSPTPVPTDSPTPILPTVTPITLDVATPPSRSSTSSPITINILDDIQFCSGDNNNPSTWNEGNSDNRVKIAFTLSRDLVDGERIEIQVKHLDQENWSTRHSGIARTLENGFTAIDNDPTRGTIHTYEGKIDRPEGMELRTIYQWRFVIRNGSNEVIAESTPDLCYFQWNNEG